MNTKQILTLLLFVTLFIGCRKSDKEIISVKGSDTMVNLMQQWAELFMEENPNIVIQINGGGSGTGIASLLNKTTDIATLSRELKKEEFELAKKLEIIPHRTVVASDEIVVIVNKNNPLCSLDVSILKQIYSGKISDWSKIENYNKKIVAYGRESSSGTYEFFKIKILCNNLRNANIDFAPKIQSLQGTVMIGEAVAKDKKGIGYGGIGYFRNRSDIRILSLTNSKGNTPTLKRNLYCITNGTPQGSIKKIIDFITSDKGQKLVDATGFIPLNN